MGFDLVVPVQVYRDCGDLGSTDHLVFEDAVEAFPVSCSLVPFEVAWIPEGGHYARQPVGLPESVHSPACHLHTKLSRDRRPVNIVDSYIS